MNEEKAHSVEANYVIEETQTEEIEEIKLPSAPPKVDSVHLKLAKKMLATEKEDDRVLALEKLILAESTNFQWLKIFLNFAMIIILFLIALFRGTRNKKSLVGVIRCTDIDFGLFGILLGLGFVLLFVSILVLRREHTDKVNKGYVFTKGDFVATPKTIVVLSIVSLVGGFLVSSSGIGGGLIFNPFLMQIDIAPPVASATGSYMVMFTTLAGTMINALNGNY